MTEKIAKFVVGQIVQHRLFDYRGVIFDIDPVFQGTGEWYDRMARSHPPKDAPWYHVMVDNASHTTYVAERNLLTSGDVGPIAHPALDQVFSDIFDGRYVMHVRPN